ncbi:MAG TPA: glucoamylase family protein [Phnomibacter sp.]|nr:glucoamylase family protein [Phnomibacter sp.]
MAKMKVLAIVLVFAVLADGCRSQRKTVSSAPDANIADISIYDAVQRATFQYFWDGAEPNSGLARERVHLDGAYPNNDQNVVTSGGGGFGVMAILSGIERGYITRQQAVERYERILTFLETADRFHGAWPHWWFGETGKVKPFSRRDDGGDLVETAFMAQGLLCVRQYFKDGNAREKKIAERADKLWRGIDFDFYRNGKNVLYWHWSPNVGWEMNHEVRGYNECLIMYVLAASSPTHPISAEVYHEGWARGGKINELPAKYKDIDLGMNHHNNEQTAGPLFWAHYSYLGLDPRGLKDKYADYWKHNTDHTLIHYNWCVDNPKGFKGYGPNSWGMTSSYSMRGYSGHAPTERRDLGVIAPTAALSSMPYTPVQSQAAMKYWYTDKREKLFGKYGFFDAFSETENWYPQRYLAIDQGPIVVMMENYRSGLLWNLFMSAPEIKVGLRKLGFESPHLN